MISMKQKREQKVICTMLSVLVGGALYSNYAVAADATVNKDKAAATYMGVGKDPAGSNLIVSSGEVWSKPNGKVNLIDYRPTSKKPANDNANGEGAGPLGNLDPDNYGALAVGMGAFTSHGMSAAVGTYAQAIGGSAAVGAGSYASFYGAALGINAYANNKAVALGSHAMANNGIAIGENAMAGSFYKYIQADGNQATDGTASGLAIGNSAKTYGGISLGDKAVTNSFYGVAIGSSTYVRYNGVAIGQRANVVSDGGIALGVQSSADRYSGSLGYVPFSYDGKVSGVTAGDISKLGNVLGKTEASNFTTKYAAQIAKYNELNAAYAKISADREAQKEIIKKTKGSKDAAEKDAYTKAVAAEAQLAKDAVAATNERTQWTNQNKDFMSAMESYNNDLATFRATEGAVSIGSAATYKQDGTVVSAAKTRQLTNLAAGTADTDAVNVAQLKGVAKEVDNKANLDASNITPDLVDKWQAALGINPNTVGNVDAITVTGGDNVSVETTYNDDKSRVNYKVSIADQTIKDVVMPEVDKKLDTKVNIDGSNLTTDAINTWKDKLGVQNLDHEVVSLQNRIDGLDHRMDKVGAGAAALAGLHPLEFDATDKFSAAVSMGSYKGESSAALGAFYRPNEDTMISAASTLGDETMFNVGVSLKFGTKADGTRKESMNSLRSEVVTLRKENQALANELDVQKKELEEQKAMIQQLMTMMANKA